LNTVRRALSNIKGGGLLRACAAEQMATLVISDVLDDDLGTIASGPTYDAATIDPDAAVEVIRQLLGPAHEIFLSFSKVFHERQSKSSTAHTRVHIPSKHTISVLANNATAVDAAGTKAVELGYRYLMHCHRKSEGDARIVGEQMAHSLSTMSEQRLVDCEIVGGEPTVDMHSLSAQQLSPGSGGRNQHVVLSAALEITNSPALLNGHEFCILSGGTDGEDGNTPCAGAWIDHQTIRWFAEHRKDVENALAHFDSNSIFAETGNLIDSGLTGTNVCDLRLALFKS
jgi:hydroxypyruvate reductase